MNTKRPTKKTQATLTGYRQGSRIRNTPQVKRFHNFVTRWLNAELDLTPESREDLGFSIESKKRILDLLQEFRFNVGAIERSARAQSRKTGLITLSMNALAPYATYITLVFDLAKREWQSIVQPAEHNIYPAYETLAAYGIAELTKLGGLDRLRSCDCGRWYFAPREKSPACSTACRKQYWDQKPENKAARKVRDVANRKNFRSGSFGSSKAIARGSQKRRIYAKASK